MKIKLLNFVSQTVCIIFIFLISIHIFSFSFLQKNVFLFAKMPHISECINSCSIFVLGTRCGCWWHCFQCILLALQTIYIEANKKASYWTDNSSGLSLHQSSWLHVHQVSIYFYSLFIVAFSIIYISSVIFYLILSFALLFLKLFFMYH